jgi:hypothetical protein
MQKQLLKIQLAFFLDLLITDNGLLSALPGCL